MTAKKAQWPKFVSALLALQAIVQVVAFGVERLHAVPLPVSPETVQWLLLGGLLVIAAVAVAGSAWLGRGSRAQAEGMAVVIWSLVALAVAAILLGLFETYGMFMFPEEYAPAVLVWIYAEETLRALIWASIAAAISLRLWAVLALAVHTGTAWITAGLLPQAMASAAIYGWDRDIAGLSAVMSWISAISLVATVLAAGAFVWPLIRRIDWQRASP